MADSQELKKIKKEYGENFMKLCRQLFPTILEEEGKLSEILSNSFANNSRTLYEDIISNNLQDEFQEFIYNNFQNKEEISVTVDKTPYELLEEAGYTLYECNSEEEIQSFKKYYSKNEELCTFKGGRLDSCIVFFAVKNNVDNIKREDFDNPKREDEYGTSVMSIQFNKEGICTVSIKNRYNHTLKDNPDATYGNDLDKIITGLEGSFKELLSERGLKLDTTNKEEFSIPNYVRSNNGKYYKYNFEQNGIYYCPGNIVIEKGEAKKIGDPEKKILIDGFILDLENKKIEKYDEKLKDCFNDYLKDIEKIEILKNREEDIKTILIKKRDIEEQVEINIDKDNQIIEYKDDTIEEVHNNFLFCSKNIRKLQMDNLKNTGDFFMNGKKKLKELLLANVEKIGSFSVQDNETLIYMYVPNLKKVENYSFSNNLNVLEYNFPLLESAGNGCFSECRNLKMFIAQKLRSIGDRCISSNNDLEEVIIPNLEEIKNNCFNKLTKVKSLNINKVKKMGFGCVSRNFSLEDLNIESLEKTDFHCFCYNKALIKLSAPNLVKVANECFLYNDSLEEIYTPKLREINGFCFFKSPLLKKIVIGDTEYIAPQQINKLKSLDLTYLDKKNIFQRKEIFSIKDFFKNILDKVIEKTTTKDRGGKNDE